LESRLAAGPGGNSGGNQISSKAVARCAPEADTPPRAPHREWHARAPTPQHLSLLGNIYAQIIDDQARRTLVSASSIDKGMRAQVKGGGNVAGAKEVGKAIAERAKAAGIEKVVFDRGGYRYHGRVQALANAAREAGLNF